MARRRGPSGGGGEEGKREAREGGGMLRSRGNRLPSERAALSISLHHPGRACRLSFSFYRTVRQSLFLCLFLSPPAYPAGPARLSGIEDLSLILLLFSSFARKGIVGRAFSFSPWHPLDRLYRLVDSPPPPPSPSFPDPRRCSSAIVATGTLIYIYTHTQVRTRDRRTLFPRRTAPFFVPDRDSSPISFRSPVIN